MQSIKHQEEKSFTQKGDMNLDAQEMVTAKFLEHLGLKEVRMYFDNDDGYETAYEVINKGNGEGDDDIDFDDFEMPRIDELDWTKIFEGSLLLYSYTDYNVIHHGRECSVRRKDLLVWKGIAIIFNYENEGHDIDVMNFDHDGNWSISCHNADNFNDSEFMSDIKDKMTVSEIIAYFKGTGRSKEEAFKYISSNF